MRVQSPNTCITIIKSYNVDNYGQMELTPPKLKLINLFVIIPGPWNTRPVTCRPYNHDGGRIQTS